VPRYDLRAGMPDLSAFPRRAWLATARKVLAAREAAARSGVGSVLLDPVLEAGAWRWDRDQVAGLSARAHAGETQ
jgi:hypothetical protein